MSLDLIRHFGTHLTPKNVFIEKVLYVVETVVINNTDSLDNPAPTNSPVKVLAFEPNVMY